MLKQLAVNKRADAVMALLLGSIAMPLESHGRLLAGVE